MPGGIPVIVCTLWDDIPAGAWVQLKCLFCGARVALSVENQKLVEQLSINPICGLCYQGMGAPRPAAALLSGRLRHIGRPENN